MEKINCQTIMDWLHGQVAQKIPIAPSLFVESGEKLNLLLGDEEAKYADLFQTVAKMKVALMREEAKPSMAEIKNRIEATDEYKEMIKQKAFISRIQEHIRLCKLQARMTQDEMRGY